MSSVKSSFVLFSSQNLVQEGKAGLIAHLIPSPVWPQIFQHLFPPGWLCASRVQPAHADLALGGSAALSPLLPPRHATLLEKDFEAITAC